ncbi:ABC transporter substrate-binding protein [Paenactinomyces guangxiensis]|uniref:ABC transporter substrate-binding protein n=1 Tax=Paenactinomyces guangxiensis TaxID=1490290 RepID=A0A7W2A8H6_9BACL|nr:ABC transporter substrate-binding protein [Paenactinomyces guangxiensis]MBA4493833.1 ABC transporter substrate-binding protein [Paenactinomyces guangxiensis]MBH8591299.1 ABC transporter substrate-binding protein [Paenactinomyces guangxiensis]
MKRKLHIVFIAVMVTVMSVLAGCNTEAGKGNGPTEIEFWYSLGGELGKVLQEQVKQFNESQNEVKVKAVFQGDYYENHQKLLTSIAAKNAPDVSMIEVASVASFADNGVLENLKPYAEGKNGTDEQDFVKGLMGNSYYKGQWVAVPYNRSTPLLYVNKDMLKKAGLNPEGPKTWEELRQYAQKLTQKNGNQVTRWGFETPIDIWFYEGLVFQNGGRILSEDGKQPMFNQPDAVEPVKFWNELIYQDKTMKMPPGEKYNAWDVAKSDFINQKVAMIFTSTGDLRYLSDQAKFEVGTAFMPKQKTYGAPTGGANLVMLATSPKEEKEAAWKFIKWMTETEQTIQFSQKTGYMPVRQSAIDSEEMKAYYKENPNFKVAVDQLQYAQPRPVSPAYKELQETIMKEIQRSIVNNQDPQKALNDAAGKAKNVLNK